ncbi:hypothetical protein [Dactylosporangium sp. NPDC005555]|uniref:hypothetical protein n=1 Tax=Dactylosporangium sp. NPDC005555 TaxID=3154889 RepID=UPI0033B4C130
MHQQAYESQCTVEEQRHTAAGRPIRHPRLALLALALGTFAIGTGEFGSNGSIQLFAADLGVTVPVATHAITAYAVGVMLGSPAIVVLAARINRRTLLPCLFGVGAAMMAAIPTIQVQLSRLAPGAPTLKGALNLAALNLANALGAVGGAVTLDAGWGTLSTVWAGFVMTAAGLLLYGTTVARPFSSPAR